MPRLPRVLNLEDEALEEADCGKCGFSLLGSCSCIRQFVHVCYWTREYTGRPKRMSSAIRQDVATMEGALPEPDPSYNDDDGCCLVCATIKGGFMIQCEGCENWYHGDCVNIDADTAHYIDHYECGSCQLGQIPPKFQSPVALPATQSSPWVISSTDSTSTPRPAKQRIRRSKTAMPGQRKYLQPQTRKLSPYAAVLLQAEEAVKSSRAKLTMKLPVPRTSPAVSAQENERRMVRAPSLDNMSTSTEPAREESPEIPLCFEIPASPLQERLQFLRQKEREKVDVEGEVPAQTSAKKVPNGYSEQIRVEKPVRALAYKSAGISARPVRPRNPDPLGTRATVSPLASSSGTRASLPPERSGRLSLPGPNQSPTNSSLSEWGHESESEMETVAVASGSGVHTRPKRKSSQPSEQVKVVAPTESMSVPGAPLLVIDDAFLSEPFVASFLTELEKVNPECTRDVVAHYLRDPELQREVYETACWLHD